MNIGLFEDHAVPQLFPLTWLRPAFELVCGRDELRDKVHAHVGRPTNRFWTRPALRDTCRERYPENPAKPSEDWFLLNASAMVTGDTAPPLLNCCWMQGQRLVGVHLSAADVAALPENWSLTPDGVQQVVGRCFPSTPPPTVRLIEWPWDLISAHRSELLRQLAKLGNVEPARHPGTHFVNPTAIHVDPTARIKPGVVLDAEDGPIFVHGHAQIQPNAVLIGPCFIGSHSIIRPGAVIRENTSIGPMCRVGGEVEGSIIAGFSNKQHDGFLGHSYVGWWVNLGADTVTSDLKNTYGTIRVAINGREVETNQKFLGSFIGDYVKTGIGTILPTGCVLGVAANIFRRGPVPKFVPSFSWLTDQGLSEYRIDKALEVAAAMMARRQLLQSKFEEALLRQVFQDAPRIEAPVPVS